MLTRLGALAIAFALAATVAAQDKGKSDSRREVVVTGCVERTWLKVRQSDMLDVNYADKYHLRGSKDLVKKISHDLDGHRVEVTGLLDDPAKVQGDGKSVTLGKKSRLYVNSKEKSPVPPVVDPSIDVRSFRDLEERCR